MDQGTVQIFFAFLRSAIRGTRLTEEEQNTYSPELLDDLFKLSSKHNVSHLLAYAIKQNGLITEENTHLEKHIFKAVCRYEQLRYEYEKLCAALETTQIPFLPLKGAVIRNYYPEAYMRTSCDIDILLHRENLDAAISYLRDNLNYTFKERTTHDVSLFSPAGIHVELHFDLVEEGRANNAVDILCNVWENVSLHENSKYWYEMSDSFFYFYHIAHMAKHFESGGCGIRPFIDLWIMDRLDNADFPARDGLLAQGDLLKFATTCRDLSNVWFDSATSNETLQKLQRFLLRGGVYGSTVNRVALQQKSKGGRVRYILSRIFIPHAQLKRYYPILCKHPWLSPLMQVRRWLMLLNPRVAKMAKRELATNKNLDKEKAKEMNLLLHNIGLK